MDTVYGLPSLKIPTLEEDKPESCNKSFNLINTVNDNLDKLRGPRLIDDVYLRLDDVSADDLLLEKSMITKFLISRYKNVTETILRKPRDLMFAIIECICSGIKLYLTTERGDCCYIDDIEIFNADIFCSTNDWILGFIGEKVVKDDQKLEQQVGENVDKINIFDDNMEDPILDLVSSWKRLKSNNLPPLVCYFGDEMEVSDENNTNEILQETRLENAKIINDIENLKKSYINLNTDSLSKETNNTNCCFPIKSNLPTKKLNILKLIVDMKELERLLTFLIYVDRYSSYNGLNIFIQNKSGTSKSFCAYKKSRLSNDVENTCLKNENSDRLKKIYDNITNKSNLGDETGEKTDEEKTKKMTNRILEIFEWCTYLYLDKISTVIIESLFYKSSNLKITQSHKFGIVDLLCPKLGRSFSDKIDVSNRRGDISAISSYKRQRVGVSFDE